MEIVDRDDSDFNRCVRPRSRTGKPGVAGWWRSAGRREQGKGECGEAQARVDHRGPV